DSRALCSGRIGRRPLLFQLSRRHRPDRGFGVRQNRRLRRRESRERLMATQRLNELSACDIAQGVATGAFSAEAVVRDCLDRIEERDKQVKAWAFINGKLALDQ